jgi:hypothetical protein
MVVEPHLPPSSRVSRSSRQEWHFIAADTLTIKNKHSKIAAYLLTGVIASKSSARGALHSGRNCHCERAHFSERSNPLTIWRLLQAGKAPAFAMTYNEFLRSRFLAKQSPARRATLLILRLLRRIPKDIGTMKSVPRTCTCLRQYRTCTCGTGAGNDRINENLASVSRYIVTIPGNNFPLRIPNYELQRFCLTRECF